MFYFCSRRKKLLIIYRRNEADAIDRIYFWIVRWFTIRKEERAKQRNRIDQEIFYKFLINHVREPPIAR